MLQLNQNFREFIGLLNDNGVEYLAVGGYSVAHHGFPRYTGDFDIWINPTLNNGEKLLLVLKKFGFESLNISPEDFVKKDLVLQLGMEPLRIDILTSIDGVNLFEKAFANCDIAEYDELKINFIGYNDLITNKKSSGRLQDQRDIEELKKIKK